MDREREFGNSVYEEALASRRQGGDQLRFNMQPGLPSAHDDATAAQSSDAFDDRGERAVPCEKKSSPPSQLATADGHPPQPALTNANRRPSQFSLMKNIRKMPSYKVFVLVVLGGATGAMARYGFIEATLSDESTSSSSYSTPSSSSVLLTVTALKPFPYGTFISNMVGCTLIGFFQSLIGLPYFSAWQSAVTYLRALIITGFIGALTTMSSYALDTVQLFQRSKKTVDDGGIINENVTFVENGQYREGKVTDVKIIQDNGGQWLGVIYIIASNAGGVSLVFLALRLLLTSRHVLRLLKAPAESPQETRKDKSEEKTEEKAEELEMSTSAAKVEHGETVDVPEEKAP